jgi:hypothetical protein
MQLIYDATSGHHITLEEVQANMIYGPDVHLYVFFVHEFNA